MGAGGSKENEDKVVKIKTLIVDPNQGSRSTIVAVNQQNKPSSKALFE